VNQEKLGRECAELRAAVDALKEEKIQALSVRKAAIAAEQKKFWDYHIGHSKRLRELRVALEKVINEIGVWCLPYPEKGSTIGDAIAWFEKEIRALSSVIAEVNKNFLFYCLVDVARTCKVPPHRWAGRNYKLVWCFHLRWSARWYSEAFCPHHEEVVVFVWFV
jgi:hypothetical protein